MVNIMAGHDPQIPGELDEAVGAVISAVRRHHYVFEGTVERTRGAIEFDFTNGRTILLDEAADGQSVRVTSERWVDPFREPLTAMNRDYVARSGKWTVFDVTGEAPYSLVVGQVVEGIDLVRNESSSLSGFIVLTKAVALRIENVGDEIKVEPV